MARKDIVEALIDTQGELYSEAMGAHIARDTPQELFHWLIGALMLSARIGADKAVEGCRALRKADLHKIREIRAADRRAIVKILNENGYARFDESTTDYIRAAAELVEDRYDGDLRKIRDAAESGADVLKAVQEVKGIGKMGAAIFAREMQLVWDVLYPQADGPALQQAKSYGLPEEAEALADLAGSRERFVRLLSALTRAKLEGPSAAVDRAVSG